MDKVTETCKDTMDMFDTLEDKMGRSTRHYDVVEIRPEPCIGCEHREECKDFKACDVFYYYVINKKPPYKVKRRVPSEALYWQVMEA